MKPPDPWQNLTALARTAPPAAAPAADPDDDARFAAHVVGRWSRRTPPPVLASSWGLPWEAWSLRGVAMAGVTAALMLTWNFSLLNPDNNPPDDVLPPDPVAELAATF